MNNQIAWNMLVGNFHLSPFLLEVFIFIITCILWALLLHASVVVRDFLLSRNESKGRAIRIGLLVITLSCLLMSSLIGNRIFDGCVYHYYSYTLKSELNKSFPDRMDDSGVLAKPISSKRLVTLNKESQKYQLVLREHEFKRERLKSSLASVRKTMTTPFFIVLAIFLISFVITKQVYFRQRKGAVQLGLLASLIPALIPLGMAWLIDFVYRHYYLKEQSNRIVLGDKEGYLTMNNLALHTQIIGGSGSGKTVAIKRLISQLDKKRGLVVIDCKADYDFFRFLQETAKNTGRKLVAVSLTDPQISSGYNPFLLGDHTELSAQVIDSIEWSEVFYKTSSESAVQAAFLVLTCLRDQENRYFDLSHLNRFLTDSQFRKEIYERVDKSMLSESQQRILERFMKSSENSDFNKNISGLVANLEKLLASTAGAVFTDHAKKYGSASLKAALQGEYILYIFMNPLRLGQEISKVAGKMIIKDLMKLTGAMYENNEKVNATVIVDEFSAFATESFLHLLEKIRGVGISLVLSYQSRSALKSVAPGFELAIEENTGSKIIFQIQNPDDAEDIARTIGTYESFQDTERISEDLAFGSHGTGEKSRRSVECFHFHPNEIKNLKTGEAIIICRKNDPHFGKTKIYMPKLLENVEPYERPLLEIPKYLEILKNKKKVESFSIY